MPDPPVGTAQSSKPRSARSWVLSGWHEGSPGSGAVYVDGPVLQPGESVTVSEQGGRMSEQSQSLRITEQTCECENPDRRLFVWRADRDWWSCEQCDGRVRPLTEQEKESR